MRCTSLIGLLPVDRGQVQRTLPADLEEELALFVGLMRLVGAESQPAGQTGQRHHQRPARRSSPAARATSAAWPGRLPRRGLPRRSRAALSVVAVRRLFGLGRLGGLATARLRLGGARRLLGGCRLAQFPVGGSSIVCHVCSSVALRARLDCVYTRPSGPTYVPVAGSYSAAAIGGGAGPGGGAACAGGEPGRQLRDGLPGQRRVRVTLPVPAVVERYVVLVALALLDRGRPFAWDRYAGQVAGTAHIERRVLRDAAVNVTWPPDPDSPRSWATRRCWAGRKPVVHGGGRLRFRLRVR